MNSTGLTNTYGDSENAEYTPEFVLKKQYFISHRTDDVYSAFNFEPEPIGQGSFGVVFKATERSTGQVRAIKQIPISHLKDKNRYNNFINEVKALKTLDHPNIIKLYEVYENDNAVYLVQELCDGGELFDYITTKQSLNEAEASKIFAQMVGSIIYCHKNRICHRDLKPENFMLSSRGDDWTVKLIDFGISRSYFKMESANTSDQLLRMKSIAGTTPYMAPEVFVRNYSSSCDIWSLGVILYIMLSGYPPFEGYTESEIAQKILKQEYDYDDEIWNKVSDSAKDLISKMIVDEKERITPKESLGHSWVTENHEFPEPQTNKILIERILKFQSANKLRKTILSYLASKASDEDMKEEIDFFNKIDINKDGYITLKELKNGLKDYTNDDKDLLKSIMNNIDTEKNGAISFNEFLAAVLSDSISKDYEKIAKAFKFFDRDNNGMIDDKELKLTLAGSEFKHIETKIFTDVINECCEGKKGQINFNDFMRLMSIKIEDSCTSISKVSTIR